MLLHGARGATRAMASNGTRLGVVAADTGLLLTACGVSGGGSAEATTTESSANARVVKAGLKQPRGCFLTVFLAHDVTPKQKNGVQTLMVTSKRVSAVSFVSKELAL